jgi:hypothetical protein
MSTEDRKSRLAHLEILLARVVVMRRFQRSYSNRRTRVNLAEARLSEARVDALIRELSEECLDTHW